MIPDDAVSAACAAFAEQRAGYTYTEGMRAALEAAAPYIFAHILAFANERDSALGAIRSHITTYELREILLAGLAGRKQK